MTTNYTPSQELRERLAEALVQRGLAHDGYMATAGADAILKALGPELRRLAEYDRIERVNRQFIEREFPAEMCE